MKAVFVNQGSENSMRLQGVGIVKGTQAKEIKEGDFLMWNFGSIYVVNKIKRETEKSIVILTSPMGESTEYEQRLLKKRLVCKLNK